MPLGSYSSRVWTLTTRLSFTARSNWQPTPQYTHTTGTWVNSASRPLPTAATSCSASTGQADTQCPQYTQPESSKVEFLGRSIAFCPSPLMASTPCTWTLSQASMQRAHKMHLLLSIWMNGLSLWMGFSFLSVPNRGSLIPNL